MRTLVVTIVVGGLAACGSRKAPAKRDETTGTSRRAGCISPLDFGATVGDGQDDRAAVQAALDAACSQHRPVCLPAGELHVARRYGTGADNAWSLQLACDGVELFGEGDASRLVMLGSAKVGAMTGPGAWWLLKVSGANHTLHDFAIDGGTRSLPTGEQTHLIKIAGPAENIALHDLRLRLPEKGPGTGGDCIQAGGDEKAPVHGLTIERVHGDDCDRSFVGLQRWVSHVVIASCDTAVVGDQAIDEEPTGVGTIGDVAIRDCVFNRNGRGEGTALTITGGAGGAQPGYDHLVERTQLDGAVLVFNSERVTFKDVRIVSSGPAPTIAVKKRSADVRLENVYAEHTGGAAPVVFFGLHTSTWPTRGAIVHSQLVQRGLGDVVRGEPVVGLEIRDSTLSCAGADPTASAVAVRAVAADIDGIVVRDNRVTGCKHLLRASATPAFTIRATTATNNVFEGGVAGVVYENAPPTQKPRVDRNTFGHLGSGAHVVGAGGNGYDGSNP